MTRSKEGNPGQSFAPAGRSLSLNKSEMLAVLTAYGEAVAVACPELLPDMANWSHGWAKATEAALARELERRLLEASEPSCSVRLFFKLGEELIYGGCNRQFAADAGLKSAAEMIGLNDFDARISWVSQAGKYRKDDRDVMQKRQPKLGIIERQTSASGNIWLDTSKMPILNAGTAVGVFGTYEVIDGKTAFLRSQSRQR